MNANKCKYCKNTEVKLQQAHREGWEQAKAEAAVLVNDMFHRRSFGGLADFSDAIAAMEYKEKANDQTR